MSNDGQDARFFEFFTKAWYMLMYFPVSGIHIFPAIPVIIGFVISLFTSMGGVAGAFLLLPFQFSVLGFTSPSVSATNLVFNIFATPSGIYRYIRERRMAWPLAWLIIVGTLPGILIGVVIRIKYLPDPGNFKIFIGVVLLYLAIRLLYDLTPMAHNGGSKVQEFEKRFKEIWSRGIKEHKDDIDAEGAIRTVSFSWKRYSYTLYGETFSLNILGLLSLTFIVGIIGGIYGIGGAAFIAPSLITILGLPVYTIGGAALLGTFLTSIAGVISYIIIAPIYEFTGLSIMPDWGLGALFGIGGFLGAYCGAGLQKYFPAEIIRFILGSLLMLLSLSYILNIF
jgi:uncharacterized membrane protein YfcA